jgi:hypothetical protein
VTTTGIASHPRAEFEMMRNRDRNARDLEERFVGQNTSGTNSSTVIPATFLRITVTV